MDEQSIDYNFHDFRKDGLDAEAVESWIEELGWERLVNKRSTSWKQLSPEAREAMDAVSAVKAIMEQPTLIKRPLLDTGHVRITGFSAEQYLTIFSQHTL